MFYRSPCYCYCCLFFQEVYGRLGSKPDKVLIESFEHFVLESCESLKASRMLKVTITRCKQLTAYWPSERAGLSTTKSSRAEAIFSCPPSHSVNKYIYHTTFTKVWFFWKVVKLKVLNEWSVPHELKWLFACYWTAVSRPALYISTKLQYTCQSSTIRILHEKIYWNL